MKYIFAIRDEKARAIIPTSLMVEAHEAPAIRAFSEVVADKRGMIARYPQDFGLWKLAGVHDDGAVEDLNDHGTPELVITGDKVKAMQPTEEPAS